MDAAQAVWFLRGHKGVLPFFNFCDVASLQCARFQECAWAYFVQQGTKLQYGRGSPVLLQPFFVNASTVAMVSVTNETSKCAMVQVWYTVLML
jgi:hypothetical protein